MKHLTIARHKLIRSFQLNLTSGLLPQARHLKSSSWHSRSFCQSFFIATSPQRRNSAASLQWPIDPTSSHVRRPKSYTTAASNNSKITGLYFAKADPLDCKRKELTKAQIAEQFDLQYRDLRDIDLKSEAATRILVRPATILVQFFDLCVIIQADEAILIDRIDQDQGGDEDEEGESHSSASTPLTQIFKDSFASINDAATAAAEVNLSSQLAFEFHALEAAFVTVLSSLRAELTSAREEAESSARQLQLEPGHAAAGVDQLFERSQRLFEIEQKARLLRQTTREVLDTDEDLAAMYLSDTIAGKPHAVSDHQEAEYMLEAYHKAADTLAESAGSAISVIKKKGKQFPLCSCCAAQSDHVP